MNDRRSRFRAYMKALNPTSDPKLAFDECQYISPPRSVGARIATRLELDPGSSHLLVGGIGSGKTTELLSAERALNEVPDLVVFRLDVPTRHQLNQSKPGVLLALVASEMADALKLTHPHFVEKLRQVANGHWAAVTHEDIHGEDRDGDPYSTWIDGVLVAPEQAYPVASLEDLLPQAVDHLGKRVVVLFDGLDRLFDVEDFATLLEQDLQVLHTLGIGAVVVGPQHLRFGSRDSVRHWFDEFHLHSATSPDTDDGREFLGRVLRARVDAALLPDDACDLLIRGSGGLLRDLISMARHAGEEAYMGGAEAVDREHAQDAVERLGRNLALGITSEMVRRLLELAPKQRHGQKTWPPFTPATDVDISLLLNRLVIELATPTPSYRVHPALEPLFPGLRKSA